MQTGLIHIYCGDGKGKTTAALGLALRCAGRGGRICLVQFLKSRETGELLTLAQIPAITVLRGRSSGKFTFQMTEEELALERLAQEQLFERAVSLCRREQPDMLILDEILPACHRQLVQEETVLRFLRTRPAGLEVVLTGRSPSPTMIDAADYVSDIRKLKHPYDKGIPARTGIEK